MDGSIPTSSYPRLPTVPYPRPIPPGGPFEQIEAEITELWGHISAATYRFLKLLAEYDAGQCWGYHGCRDCAHWLNWRCGIGIGAAREKIRVARALEDLPRISAAFAEGRVSYSKVRAMTRVATPENEKDLLNIALHGTASHMERLTRLYRRVECLEEAKEAFADQQQRYLDYYYDETDALVIRARLPGEIGEALKKALEAAEAELRADGTPDEKDNRAEKRVSAETSRRIRHVNGRLAPESDAELEEDTPRIRRADALCRLAEHFLQSPPDVADTVASADRYQVTVHIDQSLLCGLAEPPPSRAARCGLEDARPLAVETARRLACDSALVGIVETPEREPLSVGRKTRSIPPALRRALRSRDDGCRFPGCTRTRFTDGHHVQHWADGGETKLSNLVTLCRFHHRLVHEGGFGLERTDDGLFVFSRPDGSRIEETGWPAGPRFRGNAALETINAEQGLAIDADTCRSQWLGERLDYDTAVGCLIEKRDRARPA